MRITKIREPRTVLATDVGIRRPHHGYPYAPWIDSEAMLPPGLVWFRNADQTISPLKRSRIVESAGTTLIRAQEGYGLLFEIGDEIVSSEYISVATFTGTWDGTEVVSIDIDGNSGDVDLSLIGTVASPLEAAAAAAARLGGAGHDETVTALAWDNTVAGTVELYLFSRAAGPAGAHTIAFTVTGGTGAITSPVGASAPIAVGTVVTVADDDCLDNLTLAAVVTVPIGLGVKVAQPEASLVSIRSGGIRPEEHNYDIQENYGLMTSGTLDLPRMYWDQQLSRAFPEIQGLT